MNQKINVSELAQELTQQTPDKTLKDISAIAEKIKSLNFTSKDKIQSRTIFMLYENAIERNQQFTIHLLQKVVDKLTESSISHD